MAAVWLGQLVAPAAAQVVPAPAGATEEHWVAETAKRVRTSRHYFIEFRGRSAATYGHMYVLYGRVNGSGEVVRSRIAGLHPAGDRADCVNCSLFNWTVGHMVPVPAETGASDGDLEEKYVTSRARVWLSYAQYKKLDAYIRQLQASNPTWNALWNNCVTFGREIATAAGLKTPPPFWMTPDAFVNSLASINGIDNTKQLPLRDAAARFIAPKKPPKLPQEKPQALRMLQPDMPVAAAPSTPDADTAAAKPAMSGSATNETKTETETMAKPAAESAPAADTKPAEPAPAKLDKPKKKPVVEIPSSPAQAVAAKDSSR